ncbi:MAG TPA: hypothetical protein DCS66_17650 [Flavobacteriaceae bacterium]|nr:hypothetical protein [Flavobacteriaceae bacterium]
MSFFGKHFVRLLEQEEIEDTVTITDTEAMETQLDPGTEVTDYEVDAPTLDGGEITAQSNAAQAGELVGIIGAMEEFTNYLNSEQSDSVQSLLHAASCDTLFNKIAGAETKKIARVAMELSSLIENLKGYLHTVETGPNAGPAR